MKVRFAIVTLFLAALGLSAQQYPLSENRWDNPEFVDRFMGSYGVATDVEPKVTTDEAEVLKTVGAALQAEDRAAAISALEAAVGPDTSAALDYTLGSLYLQGGRNQDAVRLYTRAIKKFPNFRRAYKNMGLAYIQEGNWSKAEEFLVKAIELGDNQGNTFGLLGYAYLNEGNYASALEAYEMASLLMPTNRDWKVGLATSLQQTKQFERAIARFRELVEAEPGKKSYYISIANAQISLGNQTEAASILELVRRLGDADAAILMLLGDIYVNQDLTELAHEVYLEALATGKAPADRLVRFSTALVQRREYDLAMDMIEALRAQKTDGLGDQIVDDLLSLEAQIALAEGRDEEAVVVLEELVQRDPLNGRALMLLANHYAEVREFETAEFYFERAEKVPDVAPEAYVDHARMQVGRKEFGDAVRLLERAQAIRPRANVENYLKAVREAYQASL